MSLRLTDILFNSSKNYGDKIAYTMQMGYRTRNFTFKEIEDLSKKCAIFLESIGIKKDDKVIIIAPNSPYWIILFWGCLLIGAIPVPLNIQTAEEQIKKILDQTCAKAIFTNKLLNLKFQFNVPTYILDSLCDLISNFNPADFKDIKIDEEDLVQIMYTSGTTGDPKGVMLSHKNMASNMIQVSELINVNLEKDRLLSILPLSHIFEQTVGFLLPFNKGIHVIYAHSHNAISELLKKYKITKMGAVPEFLHIFMNRIEESLEKNKFKKNIFKFLNNISSSINSIKVSRILFYPVLKKMGGKLDTIASGGAHLDPELQQKWHNIGIIILPGYGLTETSPCITTNTFEDFKLGTVGKPIPNVQVKISEDKEILVKGPNVFKGYYKNPQKTAECFDAEGWFMTGDMGEFDSDGYLIIKGRKKYMILSASGQNVYPEDIESEINKDANVVDSCVLGIENSSGQVQIHAVIVLKPDTNVNVEEVINKVNSQMASYQKINAYSIWPDVDFPRTAIRKIKRNEVEEWVKSSNKDLAHNDGHEKIYMILSKISGVNVNKIKEESNLAQNLNIDSLMRVELLMWVEQEYGVEISEEDINQNTTVKDLSEIIKYKKNNPIKKQRLKNWPRYKFINILRQILQIPMYLLFRMFIKLKVENKSGVNLKDINYPILVMPNHISYFDPIIINMALPANIRKQMSYAAAQDQLYEKYKLVATTGELLMNSFPIQRDTQKNIKLGLEYIGQMLDKGYSVGIFPEGHVSKDGKAQPLKPGTGVIATEMGVPVLPIKITGLDKVFPYEKILPRKIRYPVTVEIMPPLKFNTLEDYETAANKIFDSLNQKD